MSTPCAPPTIPDPARREPEPGQHSPRVDVQLFTDPGCPFAFSHEPVRRRLAWLYRDGLRWRPRMIVLASSDEDLRSRGVTSRLVTRIRAELASRTGMPIAAHDGIAPPSPTRRAALSVVAARTWGEQASARLLRELRVLAMSGSPISADETIRASAIRAGLDPALLRARMEVTESRRDLEEEMAAARNPSAAAVSLEHLLSRSREGLRYSAPTYLLTVQGPEAEGSPRRAGSFTSFAVPGVQPAAVYEAAIANLAPEVARRPDPEDPLEVLEWAGEPLATAEVAAVMGIERDEAARRLRDVAEFIPADNAGYWRSISSIR